MRFRPTIRLRLTAFYTVMFLMLGVMVLAVAYLQVKGSLDGDQEGNSLKRASEQYGYTEQQIRDFNKLKLPPPPTPGPKQASTVGDVIGGVQGDITDDALHELLVGSGIALAVMVLAATLVGWLAAGRVLRPVGRLTARARDLSEENLNERLALEGPSDELKELADTLDGMLSRLEVAFDAQRNLAAHVSHELRTPISIIRAETDLVLDQSDASERERVMALTVRSAADRTEALLDSLLALARSESTMNDREAIDLADVTGDVVGEAVDRADAARVEIDLSLDTAVIRADHFLVQRLVGNLVDNAIKHNRPGGWLHVFVHADGATNEAVLLVENSGDRFSPEQIEEITKPFQRIDGRRPGYGLGTTVVQSVVRSHGGTFVVEARPEGGLRATVRLPLAPASSRDSGVSRTSGSAAPAPAPNGAANDRPRAPRGPVSAR